ncbi:DUF721 domain-containing protein [Corynebacterium anserum]|uniref:DUF721 domain-containing protein n=1 Tax=Corynebacterium anserum TaxID=2684406 RepID=A0A7G7YLD7_9CORY|nr:DciA family protein [Corynebacterium anserum]MBC2682520.1 DUF721 domain-containing protein [Corynebacterium anserum]QNH95307.1 DUF721 domain-containing protein [Corynebacterium anserum]
MSEPHSQPDNSNPPDRNLDPVAQALAALRQAGGTPTGNLPEVASRKRMRDTRGRGAHVRKRPTGLDGRADRSYRDPKPLSELVYSTIKRFGWAEDFAVGSIMTNWAEIVGPHVAEHTQPVTFNKGKRELVIQCNSTSWATQLRYMKPQILQAIERLAREDLVRDVKILAPNLGPKPKGRFRVKGRGPRDDYG